MTEGKAQEGELMCVEGHYLKDPNDQLLEGIKQNYAQVKCKLIEKNAGVVVPTWIESKSNDTVTCSLECHYDEDCPQQNRVCKKYR